MRMPRRPHRRRGKAALPCRHVGAITWVPSHGCHTQRTQTCWAGTAQNPCQCRVATTGNRGQGPPRLAQPQRLHRCGACAAVFRAHLYERLHVPRHLRLDLFVWRRLGGVWVGMRCPAPHHARSVDGEGGGGAPRRERSIVLRRPGCRGPGRPIAPPLLRVSITPAASAAPAGSCFTGAAVLGGWLERLDGRGCGGDGGRGGGNGVRRHGGGRQSCGGGCGPCQTYGTVLLRSKATPVAPGASCPCGKIRSRIAGTNDPRRALSRPKG